MNLKFKYLIAVVLTITLNGCTPFKLRGQLTIPSYLKTVYISPVSPYEPFQRELRYRLKRADVKIVDCPGERITLLELGVPEFKEEILAYSSSGQVQRSKVTYSIRFKLITKDGSNLNESNTISRMRELSKSNNQLLTNEIEEQIVRKELLNETVSELLRQITTRQCYKASMYDSSTPIDDSPC